MSTAPAISKPAARAPALLPPAPQKRSNALGLNARQVTRFPTTCQVETDLRLERDHRCADRWRFGRGSAPSSRRSIILASSASHSQMTTTRHPIARNASIARESLATFCSNFEAQNAGRVFGITAFAQPR
jgi:hypothetical protein